MARDLAGLGEALGAGIVLPACTVVGYLGGRFVGRLVHSGDVAAYVGAALGVVAGFWSLLRMLGRADSRGSPK
jgi:hypothetical protein